jgi:hypothetical protein
MVKRRTLPSDEVLTDTDPALLTCMLDLSDQSICCVSLGGPEALPVSVFL